MGLVKKKLRRHSSIQLFFLALSGVVPFVCYLSTASAYGYWLDGGEFIAASIDLGIAHPPGQPLTALIARLFAMIPIGPLALRVAIASAAMASCAAMALFCAIETTLYAMSVEKRWVALPIAFGVTLFIAGSYGWWFQAVRPEVYALQAALTCLILERLVALETAWPTSDARPLVTIAFAFGLALTNHHFLAFLLIPAILPTAARVLGAERWRTMTLAIVAGLLGLSVYLYLPLRAATNPLPNLGQPTTWSRIFWVISAQAFQKNTGSSVPLPLSDRHLDVAALLVEDLHIYCAIALLGLYVMLRFAEVRRIGVICFLVLTTSVIARAYLGFVRSNPDAQGYLLPAFAAIGVFFAAFVAVLIRPQKGVDGRPTNSAIAVALVVVLLGIAQVYNRAPKANLKEFTATDDFDDQLRRSLPTRAVVLLHAPQTIFLAWGGEAEDCLRPDVTFVPVPLLSYPGMVDSLVERNPELRNLLRGYLLNGEFGEPELQSLAAIRPVMIEMDARISPSLYQTLAPAGLYYEVIADGATAADEKLGAATQNKAYEEIYDRIGKQRFEPNTANSLLWRHFTDSLYYMGFGDRGAALTAIKMAKSIQPATKPIAEIEAVLAKNEGKGRIDVRPFLDAIEKTGQ
jgi:hypothetical protein